MLRLYIIDIMFNEQKNTIIAASDRAANLKIMIKTTVIKFLFKHHDSENEVTI